MNIEIVTFNSVIIYFEQVISEEVLDEVQRVYLLLKELKGIIDLTPSYCSILVTYDIAIYDYKSIHESITKKSIGLVVPKYKPAQKLIKIPTNYSNSLDLERVANLNNLSTDEVIRIHSKTTYRVYAIGFMVSFAYLATVDKQISTPRLETPRVKVSKGSVAIADNQTAIYPQESAGGWNIIGHTDFDEFDGFSVGDFVQFVSI